jgi:hypothetical protein
MSFGARFRQSTLRSQAFSVLHLTAEQATTEPAPGTAQGIQHRPQMILLLRFAHSHTYSVLRRAHRARAFMWTVAQRVIGDTRRDRTKAGEFM